MEVDIQIQGSCFCCGDGVTVYEIVAEHHWTMNQIDPSAMSPWVFEALEPEAKNIPNYFKKLGHSIVVAGEDFGCGSKSVEHPMAALKDAGVQLVLAESFSRYSYRNAINLGLPVMTCPGIREAVHPGDVVNVDLMAGRISNMTTGVTLQANGLGEFALNILKAGGLLEFIEQKRRYRL